jgi:hypothetical protein
MQLNFSSHSPAIAKAALACAFVLLPGHAGAQVMAAQSRSTITITATVSPRFEIGTRQGQAEFGPAVISTNAPSLRVTIVSVPIDRSHPAGRSPDPARLLLIVPD